MPARVYECSKSEAEALKKLLSYDPYLDPNVIPSSKDDKPLKEMTDEEKKAAEDRDKMVKENLDKIKQEYGDLIFARQEYSIRDGAMLGLDESKTYLYLKANEDLLNKADSILENRIKGLKRSSSDVENKVIGIIKEEEENASAGFGSIFGG
ncbi:hypothetical protein B2A_08740 [mine drainage metagenome]|uniref:Uncharacterized protein n=1 Tax=mine drainage metagenome TaxID=410659 RepID=T1B1M4_9ZZZZ